MATYIVPVVPQGSTPGYAIVVAGVPGTRVTTGFTIVASGPSGDSYLADIPDSLPFTVRWDYNNTDFVLEDIAAPPTGITQQQVRDSMKLAPSAGAPATGSVDSLIAAVHGQVTTDHGAGSYVNTAGGAGALQYTISVTVGGIPKDNVSVWVTTDDLGVNVIASGQTDSNGNVTFQLDAGDYYAWCELGGDAFPNPTAITVP